MMKQDLNKLPGQTYLCGRENEGEQWINYPGVHCKHPSQVRKTVQCVEPGFDKDSRGADEHISRIPTTRCPALCVKRAGPTSNFLSGDPRKKKQYVHIQTKAETSPSSTCTRWLWWSPEKRVPAFTDSTLTYSVYQSCTCMVFLWGVVCTFTFIFTFR